MRVSLCMFVCHMLTWCLLRSHDQNRVSDALPVKLQTVGCWEWNLDPLQRAKSAFNQ